MGSDPAPPADAPPAAARRADLAEDDPEPLVPEALDPAVPRSAEAFEAEREPPKPDDVLEVSNPVDEEPAPNPHEASNPVDDEPVPESDDREAAKPDGVPSGSAGR